ncbi:MAG: histidine kinase [Lachnospiraceae bacterium]|nr:histidine kinase [Lachnospiraceae bacterium]
MKTKEKTFSWKLRTQLMLISVITVTLLVVAVSVLNYKRSEKVIQEQSANTIQQYFAQNQYSIINFTNEVEKVLRLLMTQEQMTEYMRQGWTNQFESVQKANQVFDYAQTMMQNYEYIDSIYYFGNDGTMLGEKKSRNILNLEPDHSLPWYSLRMKDHVKENLGKIQWFGGYTNLDMDTEEDAEEKYGKIPYVTAVGGVWLGNGRYVSVVVNVRESAFVNLFTKSDASDERESYLMDSSGTIIVHRDDERLGKKADVTIKELERADGNYLMKKDIQINYYKLDKLDWRLISEISTDALYGDLTSLKTWFIVLAFAALTVGFILFSYMINVLTTPLKQLRVVMGHMENGALGEQLDESSRNELGMLGRQFNHMSRSIENMVAQMKEIEEEKRVLENEALHAQLNPHFLFNTLSNMRFMAKMGQTEVLEECFTSLGNMLQPMYRSVGDLWSLRQEMDYMSNYIAIMNCRFGGKLSMEFEIPEYLVELQVLKFILQPMVENAVEHGFAASGGEGFIVMGAQKYDDILELYVEDNGSGITELELEQLQQNLRQAENQKELYKNHVGVVNVHRRLKVHFGEAYGIRIESVPGESTCVYLRMPVITECE